MENIGNKFTAVCLSELYRKQLTEIMEEWAEHTEDKMKGGYITDFDEKWRITGSTKNIWAQARQTYMFAAMYSNISKDERWLKLAKIGRDFLISHAYAGNGRWYYELDDTGCKILLGTTSVFTDLFVLAALSQYALASGNDEDLTLIEETFLACQANIMNSDFRDIWPHEWRRGIQRHSVFMIAINAAGIAGRLLGRGRVYPFIRKCMDKLLCFFSCNSSGYLLESLQEDGSVWDTGEGRIVNPGHIFEGMWFCIDEARKDENENDIKRALEIIDITCIRALDNTYGGIIHHFDCFGLPVEESLMTNAHRIRPGDKMDWVHCEALYAFALAAVLTKEKKQIQRFMNLHEYCQRHFRPEHGGDWYPLLSEDGTVIQKNKGGKHRVAFHVPRALMNLTMLFSGDNQVVGFCR